jgi:hypothetical protein
VRKGGRVFIHRGVGDGIDGAAAADRPFHTDDSLNHILGLV